MVSARKRSFQEANGDASKATQEPNLLYQLRNTWQFANLYQWLMIFGPAVKAENIDMDASLPPC